MTREEQRAKAAHEYIQSDSVAAWNEVLAFGDFINGAKWADFHPQWIPVEERLPEKDGKYLFYDEVLGHEVSIYYDGVTLVPSVTHWMPLPEAPRKEDKK